MTSVTAVNQGGSGASFTQTTAIPLTTWMTPNADCTAASAYESTYWAGDQYAYQLDSGFSRSTCYPSSYSDYQYNSGLWYSPGVCPTEYEYVATSIQQTGSEPATTLAICCPPGVHTAPSAGWSCVEVLTTAVQGGLSFSNTLSTTQPGTTAFANPISVAWQESDLSLFTPASAPILALKSAGVTFPASSTTSSSASSSPTTSTTTSTTSTSSSSSHGLSSGASAGIGVGVTVAAVLIIAGLWWLTRHYKIARRPKTAQQPPPAPYNQDYEAGKYGYRGPVEAPDTTVHEADYGNAAVAELPGGWQPPEAGRGVRSPM